MTPLDLIGNVLAIIFTILVLLYIFGDNFMFRIAIHVFIGVSAGYAAAVALQGVLVPKLMALFSAGDYIGLAAPVVLLGLLATKLSPRLAPLGNPASGFLVGVGAAVAVGGTLQGTLLPQIAGAFALFSGPSFFTAFLNGIIMLTGVVTSLTYFSFTARRRSAMPGKRHILIQIMASIGQGFIAITLGVVFAGVLGAALSALVERFDFILNFLSLFLAG